MTELPFTVEREILIRAPRESVFGHFTDSARWAAWWGAGSTIDPRPGGRVHIVYPGGIEAGGEVLELEPPARLAFSFGFASGTPMPLGASRVEIALTEVAEGTRVSLCHRVESAAIRDQHVAGWRYQLALFANLVANHQAARLAEQVTAWAAAWSTADQERRIELLEACTADDVEFRDRWGCVTGRDELAEHIAAVRHFAAGSLLEVLGEARHCQGTALFDWVLRGADGNELGRGTNVARLALDGRFAEVVGVAD